MSRLKGLLARARSVLWPSSAEARMEEEFTFHVGMETDRLRAEGVPPDEARRRALARFGGVQQHRERMREERRAPWISDIGADVRFGARSLWKSKGLTVVAIISLASGIGANSALFSIVNALLLRPRAVPHPEQLVQLYAGHRDAEYQSLSYPSYIDFRDRNDVFTGLAAYALGWQFRLRGVDDVEQVWGEPVSSNYFDVLGIRAWRGRMFLPEEGEVPSRNPVVVIGHGLWQRRFGSDSGIIGRTIHLNSQPLTVIGIAPPGFTGMINGWVAELWVPTMMIPSLQPGDGDRMLTSRGNKWVLLVGRLKSGVTLAHARSQFAVLTTSLTAEYPDEWLRQREDGVRSEYVSLVPEDRARLHPGMQVAAYAVAAVVFVVVNLVLAIACMNLAGMLFARGMARRNEMAVRLALGAERSRIVRQLLTESLLLSTVAAAAGALLAFWSLAALLQSMPQLPEGIRVAADIRLDWRVVLYTIMVATLTGVLFGLAPALQSSRADISSVLKDAGAPVSGALRASRTRRMLVVGQVAFSLLLLVGSGLVLRSVDNVRPSRLGYASERIVIGPLPLNEHRYDRRGTQRFFEEVMERVAALPGVEAVSLTDGIPGGFAGRTRRSIGIEGYVPRPGERLEIDASIVSPGYFATMRIPVVQGRDFDAGDRDGAPCVAIINEEFSRRYFAGPASPLGRQLTRSVGRNEQQRCRIVGVVRDDAWHSLRREVPPWFAMPLLQSQETYMTLIAHTTSDPAGLVPGIRTVVRTLEPEMPLADIRTLVATFGAMAWPFRLLGFVVAGCGLLALGLAILGIYGTVSYSVAQRRREMGIRMALGADRPDILRLVVGQGMRLVGYGLAVGLVLSFLLTRVLSSLPLETTLLFGVSATDAATFGGVTILLAGVAFIACYVPALKATRVDPVGTLRSS